MPLLRQQILWQLSLLQPYASLQFSGAEYPLGSEANCPLLQTFFFVLFSWPPPSPTRAVRYPVAEQSKIQPASQASPAGSRAHSLRKLHFSCVAAPV